VKPTWPSAVIQFEDFSNNHCFDLLERYQNKYRCFNDDIQGTGAVIAAGFLNAIKRSGLSPLEQRIVVFGAGSAAVGVAKNIAQLAARLYNVPVEEVLKTFYLVDTKGLVCDNRGDKLAAHKVLLSRKDVSADDAQRLKSLEDVVKFVKPTALLGLGGVGPVFTEEIVKAVAANTARPIIFPLSNPTSKSECIPEDAYKWTNGAAIIASGSPFPATTLNGKSMKPSQGNNLYVFPGVGLGCAIAQPTYIPDDILVAASARLNALATPEQLEADQLYPPLDDIHNISAHIATEVILESQRLGIDTNKDLPREKAAIFDLVKKLQWVPHYPKELHMKLA
jgi:malate dehydrogenase (oxaloacetate-decarboxylating)